MRRREFISMAGAGLALARADYGAEKPVRLGLIGTGQRGTSLLQIALLIDGVEVSALCDIDKEHLAKAQDLVLTSGRKEPEGYSGGEEDYKRLIDRDDISIAEGSAPVPFPDFTRGRWGTKKPYFAVES